MHVCSEFIIDFQVNSVCLAKFPHFLVIVAEGTEQWAPTSPTRPTDQVVNDDFQGSKMDLAFIIREAKATKGAPIGLSDEVWMNLANLVVDQHLSNDAESALRLLVHIAKIDPDSIIRQAKATEGAPIGLSNDIWMSLANLAGDQHLSNDAESALRLLVDIAKIDPDSIIRQAKETEGAPPDLSDDIWMSLANLAVDRSLSTDAESALRLLENVAVVVRNMNPYNTYCRAPRAWEGNASSLYDGPGNKRKYEDKILHPEVLHGGFVHVPSYLEFVKSMTLDFELKKVTIKILKELVGRGCPLNAEHESTRSVQLSRALSHELASTDVVSVSVVHKTPILPWNDNVAKQDADIAIFVEDMEVGDTAHVAVTVEVQPTDLPVEGYESKAAEDATYYMGISQRSIVVVQINGATMSEMRVRAFGIVPYKLNQDPDEPPYRKTLLFEGQGVDGFKMLVSGLTGYLPRFKAERSSKWSVQMLSNFVALHAEVEPFCVVKAYDYRLLVLDDYFDQGDRRLPNIELVRTFIDPDAVLIEPQENLCVVTTKFWGRSMVGDATHWYSPVPASNLGLVLQALQKLHNLSNECGYVHGDVRLLNVILHEGKLIDFDISKPEGEMYHSTLNVLPSDGKRHPSVQRAICNGTIAKTKMSKEHDLFSMLYVVQLFEPVETESTGGGFRAWWESNVVACKDYDQLFNLIDPLLKHADRVKLKDGVTSFVG
jgi:hypothetical protein